MTSLASSVPVGEQTMVWTYIFLTDALCEESPEALFVLVGLV